MIDNTSFFFRERDVDVRYSEMDYHKILKPSSLLNFLQDIATFAADDGGFGNGTEKATNKMLEKLGYKKNGIAGNKLMKRLYKIVEKKM